MAIIGNTSSFFKEGTAKQPSIFYLFQKHTSIKYEIVVNNNQIKDELKNKFKKGMFVKVNGLIISSNKKIFVNNEPHHNIEYLK